MSLATSPSPSFPEQAVSPTSAATGTATATSLLALTTQFVQAPSCTDVWTTTSIVTSDYWSNYTTTALPVLVSDVANPRFATCQPPGWDRVVPQSRFTFSPAVCPSDWTAYSIRASDTVITISHSTSRRDLTTAYCCSRGFTLDWPGRIGIRDLLVEGVSSPACFRGLTPTSPSPDTPRTLTSSVLGPADGFQVHNAWQVGWAASDTSTLSPTPPELSCSTGLSRWVPDETVAAQSCDPDPYNSGVKIQPSLFFFLVVGIPLIVLALVANCCFFCVRHRRKECSVRKERLDAR